MEIEKGDDRSLNILLEKYKRYSYSLALKFVDKFDKLRFSLEDYVSVALNSTLIALKGYRKRETPFYAFWHRIASNEIYRFIRESYKLVQEDKLYVATLSNFVNDDVVLNDSDANTFSNNATLRESFIQMISGSNEFTALERAVVKLFLDGYEISEIAEICQKSKSSIYYNFHNAIKKMRQKMK